MYFNASRLQQRVPIKKKTPLASSRLRRSIGKFQFLWAKPNPMPESLAHDFIFTSFFVHNRW